MVNNNTPGDADVNNNKPTQSNDYDLLMIGNQSLRGINTFMDKSVQSIAHCYSDANIENTETEIKNCGVQSSVTFLYVGENDLHEELRMTIPALGRLLKTTIDRRTGLIVVNALRENTLDKKKNDVAHRINLFLELKCSKNPRLCFVDCNPKRSKFYMPDMLQLNEFGKEVYASQVSVKVMALLRTRNFVSMPRKHAI